VSPVVKVDPDHPDAAAIARAADTIRRRGLVAFPTETVYGLGANALDPAAIARLFEAKGRPPTDPLIVHIADIGQLDRVAATVPASARELAGAFWPGPLTLILPKRETVPDVVTAGLSTVGVRVPAHRVAQALLASAGVPIAAPSANRFSAPSPTRAEHVVQDLGERVDLILDGGPTPIGVESTIVDCTTSPFTLRRPGGVTREALLAHVPSLRAVSAAGSAATPQPAPGQLTRHYAPRAALTLYVGSPDAVVARLGVDARRLAAQGHRVGILAPEEDVMALAPALAPLAASGRVLTRTFGARTDAARAAHELYNAIRVLDAESPDIILAAGIGDEHLGAAVHDRLSRAAEGRVLRV
jgi:L-threonylcarbamoyladenylate synthase